MRISDKLIEMASKIETIDNEILVFAESNEQCMGKVAEALVKAAAVLKECAMEVDLMEDSRSLSINDGKQLLTSLAATPFGENVLSVSLFDNTDKFAEVIGEAKDVLEKINNVELPSDITLTVNVLAGQHGIEEITKLANVFDRSEDEGLKKVASVLDELLLTIAADPQEFKKIKEAQKKQIDEIKQKYQDVRGKLHEVWGVEDAKKAIDKSEFTQVKRPLEAPLSMRACPDHQNPMIRLGDGIYQCPLDKKVYNWQEGFKTEKGAVVPGGDVAEQTKLNLTHPRSEFDGREERLSNNGLK